MRIKKKNNKRAKGKEKKNRVNDIELAEVRR